MTERFTVFRIDIPNNGFNFFNLNDILHSIIMPMDDMIIEEILHQHLTEYEPTVQCIDTKLLNECTKKLRIRDIKDFDNQCSICLKEWTINQVVRQLPCEHIYCSKCIKEWLTKYSNSCPKCKFVIS